MSFIKKLDSFVREGYALRVFDPESARWIVYNGPYWGIWVYNKRLKRINWLPIYVDQICGATKTVKDNKTLKLKEVKDPSDEVAPLISGKNIYRKSKAEMGLFAYYLRRHRELIAKYMPKMAEQIKELKITGINRACLSEFLYFTGEVGFNWLKENPKRVESVRVTTHFTKGSTRSRNQIYKYFLKEQNLKKAIKKHFKALPNSIINAIFSEAGVSKIYQFDFSFIKKLRHSLNLEQLCNLLYFDPETLNLMFKDKNNREYLYWLSKQNQEINRFYRDIWRISNLKNYIEGRPILYEELRPILQQLAANFRIPVEEIRRIHNELITIENNRYLQIRERYNVNNEEYLKKLSKQKEESLKFHKDLDSKLINTNEVIHLVEEKDFKDEGLELHHCIGGYFTIANIFCKVRVGKEKASFQIDLMGNIIQLYGPCNQKVSDNIKKVVTIWLNTNKEFFDKNMKANPYYKQITENDLFNINHQWLGSGLNYTKLAFNIVAEPAQAIIQQLI